LRAAGLAPRKALGQHFLVSSSVVRRILEAAQPAQGFLEIGPGPGVLTRGLAELGAVTAFELDTQMAEFCAAWAPGADVRRQDALQADWAEALAALPEPRALVSNMPYQITGPLLFRAAEVRHLYSRAVLMMQREVGDKILAEPHDRKRGALSAVLQMQFEIRRVCLAPPGAFWPPPKVDSIVLCLTPRPAGPRDDELAALMRKGFTQPRKTLANNLGLPGEALAHAGLEEKVRPHQLREEEWRRLLDLG
jgi:16S rRNA (adenine1518-N6/adenine1519-N6)-dimethyltransferase